MQELTSTITILLRRERITMAKKNTTISKSRQRKIDHIRHLKSDTKMTKSELREKGLHHMKMKPEDLQAALGGLLY